MIFSGCILILVGVPFAFDLTIMVWGAILTALALWLRARALQAETERIRILGDLKVRAMRIDKRSAFAQRLWTDGLPVGSSLGDVLVLLDAQMSPLGQDTR